MYVKCMIDPTANLDWAQVVEFYEIYRFYIKENK